LGGHQRCKVSRRVKGCPDVSRQKFRGAILSLGPTLWTNIGSTWPRLHAHKQVRFYSAPLFPMPHALRLIVSWFSSMSMRPPPHTANPHNTPAPPNSKHTGVFWEPPAASHTNSVSCGTWDRRKKWWIDKLWQIKGLPPPAADPSTVKGTSHWWYPSKWYACTLKPVGRRLWLLPQTNTFGHCKACYVYIYLNFTFMV